MTVFETERLVVRKIAFSDATFIHDLVTDDSFIRHIGDKGVRHLEDAKTYIQKGPLDSYRMFGYGLFLVVRKQDDKPLGICGLIKRKELAHPDIGFAFMPEYWGQGYAYEAASATLNYGYNELALKTISAITGPGNTASIALLEKLGMVTKEKIMLMGDKQQSVYYTR